MSVFLKKICLFEENMSPFYLANKVSDHQKL